jgi:hypothetical protein
LAAHFFVELSCRAWYAADPNRTGAAPRLVDKLWLTLTPESWRCSRRQSARKKYRCRAQGAFFSEQKTLPSNVAENRVGGAPPTIIFEIIF